MKNDHNAEQQARYNKLKDEFDNLGIKPEHLRIAIKDKIGTRTAYNERLASGLAKPKHDIWINIERGDGETGKWRLDEIDWWLTANSIQNGYRLPTNKDLVDLLKQHKSGNHDSDWFINAVKAISDKYPINKGKTIKIDSLKTRMDSVIASIKKSYGNTKINIANPVTGRTSNAMDDILADTPASFWD